MVHILASSQGEKVFLHGLQYGSVNRGGEHCTVTPWPGRQVYVVDTLHFGMTTTYGYKFIDREERENPRL